MKDIFIIGSKGIPAKYGGFETFVERLTRGKINNDLTYHISCASDNNDIFEYNGAKCFNIDVPRIGSAKAVYYDIFALRRSINYIYKNNIQNPIVYVLACRIGPFIGYYKKQLEKMGGELYVNPDGHEWQRAKWNRIIRTYWKISEKYMVKHADLLICDSKNIESYIHSEYDYYNPNTTFIAYGADMEPVSPNTDSPQLYDWFKENDLKENEYYLIVGRFVPENNYETMIKEFMKSRTKKNLVLITDINNNKLHKELKNNTSFDKDNRIKFVGTVYDQKLLKQIRINAYGYIHGHEVGGTNPSLLESLATTKLNVLLDVGFNREVGMDGALYFNKENGFLANLLDKLDNIEEKQRIELGMKAKERILNEYSWEKIINSYENLFLDNCDE